MSTTTSGDEAEPTEAVASGIPGPAAATSVVIGGSGLARIWITIVACMAVALVMASMVGLTLGLSDISAATSATQTQATWIVDGYALVLACLLLPGGAIGDRYGRRRVLLIGLAIFTVASAAPVIFDTPIQIIISRGAAGAGAALVMPATLSLLTVAYPKDERAMAVGIWAGVTGSGAVVGMLGAGLLLHFWAWQSLMWTFAGIGLLVFLLTLTVRSSVDPDVPAVDWLGAILICVAVALFVFGVVQAPARGWSDPLVYGCILTGLAIVVLFCFVEVRREYPLLDLRLFARPDFAAGAATILMLYVANFGFLFLAAQYIQLVVGYSPLQTALAISPLMVPVTVLSILSLWYLPRLGLRLVGFGGLLVVTAGFFCLRGISLHPTYLDLLWPLLVLGAGIGLCSAPTTSAIMAAAPDEQQGVASAVNDVARELGAALGIAIAGSVLATRYGQALSPHLAAFPESGRGPSADSLTGALAVAHRMGPTGAKLAELGDSAFMEAMRSSLLVLAVTTLVAAVLIALWSPGRGGQQLRAVVYLTASRRDREPGVFDRTAVQRFGHRLQRRRG
jgi:MFS family permease